MKERIKIGIYGGTFAPVHSGHVKTALAFIDELSLDKLYVVPTFLPPHKTIKDGGTPQERLEMLNLAFEDCEQYNKKLFVSDYEVKKEGKSYSVYTLEHFSKESQDLYLLCGTDMFLSLETWKDFKRIFSLATIVCARRSLYDDVDEILRKKQRYEELYSAKVILMEADPIDISSSDIRKKLAVADDALAFLPKKVYSYIKENGLYCGTDIESIDAIWEEIKEKLLPLIGDRTVHVASVLEECKSLSELFELSDGEKRDLYIAAMLHDITKCMYSDKQLVICKKYGIDSNISFPVLHSYTGAYKAREMFPQYVNDAVFSAIMCHTTGKSDMTIVEKLLYLADYIEAKRTFPDCVKLRRFFYSGIKKCQNKEMMLAHLDRTLVLSFDMTIKVLLDNHVIIDNETVASRNSILQKLSGVKTAESGENNGK